MEKKGKELFMNNKSIYPNENNINHSKQILYSLNETDRPETVIGWKKEEKNSKWNLTKKTQENLLEAIEKGAMYFTNTTFSEPPPRAPEEDLSNTVHRYGDLHFDLDDESNVENAQQDLRTLIAYLVDFGAKEQQLRVFFSGKKGFHLQVPATILGSEEGDPLLPKIYKNIACRIKEQFNLTTIDTSIYCMGKGRQYRIANVKRDNGHHKIPILPNEIQLPIPKLQEMAKNPRFDINTEYQEPEPCETLKEIFQQAKTEIYEQKGLFNNVEELTEEERNQLRQNNVPPCILSTLNLTQKTDKLNYNKICYAILAPYCRDAGMNEEQTVDFAKTLIENYTDSDHYDTPGKREKELLAKYHYLSDDCYPFKCEIVKGLIPEVDCSKCPIAKNMEESSNSSSKSTQSSQLVNLASDTELFESEGDNTVYATFPVDEHHETWPVRSIYFKRWISGRFYSVYKKPPGKQAIQDALSVLEARAQFENTPQSVYTRIARYNDKIYIDLCDNDWRVIEVSPQGWRITSEAPIKFRRATGMLPLPEPVSGGSLFDLNPLLNMDEDQKVLALSWLVGAANPRGPFPILLFEGEQGTGKSTQARIFKSIIDPSSALIRTYPCKVRDLMIGAQNGLVIAYDNLSGLPIWLSDALCRLATGGGFSCRQLYTDLDETIFRSIRPVILNGIDQIAYRHDLIDRCITCTLNPIPEQDRCLEKDIYNKFDKLHPKVLGALCDALSMALHHENETHLDHLPRMADFASWIISAEQALPWEQGHFMDLYRENRQFTIEQSIENDVVASAIMTLMEDKTEWSGTASQLLVALRNIVPETTMRLQSWPKSNCGLGKRLSRIKTFLRHVNIEIESGRSTTRDRTRTIRLRDVSSVQSVQPVRNSNNSECYDRTGNWTGNKVQTVPVQLPTEQKIPSLNSTDSSTSNSDRSDSKSQAWSKNKQVYRSAKI